MISHGGASRDGHRDLAVCSATMALRIWHSLAGLVVLALACDPTEQTEPTGECALAEVASARFSIDVGGWPAGAIGRDAGQFADADPVG